MRRESRAKQRVVRRKAPATCASERRKPRCEKLPPTRDENRSFRPLFTHVCGFLLRFKHAARESAPLPVFLLKATVGCVDGHLCFKHAFRAPVFSLLLY